MTEKKLRFLSLLAEYVRFSVALAD